MLERMEFADFIECVLYGNHVYVIASGFSFFPLRSPSVLLSRATARHHFIPYSFFSHPQTHCVTDGWRHVPIPSIHTTFLWNLRPNRDYIRPWQLVGNFVGQTFPCCQYSSQSAYTTMQKVFWSVYGVCPPQHQPTSPFLEHMEHLMMLMLFVAHVARDFFESTDAG